MTFLCPWDRGKDKGKVNNFRLRMLSNQTLLPKLLFLGTFIPLVNKEL